MIKENTNFSQLKRELTLSILLRLKKMRISLQQITWLKAIHTTVLHNKKKTKYLAEISPHNLDQGFYPERGVGTYWGYSVEIM